MKTKSYREIVKGRFTEQQYWNVIDADSQKALVAEMVNSGKVPSFRRGGDVLISEMMSDVIHPEGGFEGVLEWPEKRGDKPIIREMIDTAQGQMALLEKVRIDVAFGLADIPLLYGPVYDRIAPAGGFPGGVF